jgi:hypothetical protein
MHETPEPTRDKNSGGVGLALRLAGTLLAPVVFFGLGWLIPVRTPPPAFVLSVFKVIALLWAWPYGMWNVWPLNFGVLALWGLLMSGIILIRRDTRGAATVLAFSFAWGWLVAAIAGTARGS